MLNWEVTMELSVGGVCVQRQLWGGQFGNDYDSWKKHIWSLALHGDHHENRHIYTHARGCLTQYLV